MSWEVISCWIESHPSLASWVQAVGSIAAILVAIWISSSDSRFRKRSEKYARRDAIVRCKWVLSNSGDIVEKIAKSLSDSRPSHRLIKIDIARLERLHGEIRELTFGPGMDSDIFGVVLGARLGVDRLSHKMQEILDLEDGVLFSLESLKDHFSCIDNAIENLNNMESALK
ncbi:hypothetical protein [Pseudomonas sp. MF6768]|uniref:hypothetical protein n=1 Tax=Pseudomonas sp. MF6768 TaxID=2797532 RepID=UPI0018E7AEB0|nr:hypothetical protein [Pseudomonas sp. MF6768]MBJ2241980.1 hypothetical protein [Pseudomonas sp. MF6768]